jgi:lactate 2-monooxygenase
MLGRSLQQRIYLEGLLGRKPPVPVHPEALEKAASKRMSPEAFAYVAGGRGWKGPWPRTARPLTATVSSPGCSGGPSPPASRWSFGGAGGPPPSSSAPSGS